MVNSVHNFVSFHRIKSIKKGVVFYATLEQKSIPLLSHRQVTEFMWQMKPVSPLTAIQTEREEGIVPRAANRTGAALNVVLSLECDMK